MVECTFSYLRPLFPPLSPFSLSPFSHHVNRVDDEQSYNRAVITWTTHNPKGLTSKDVDMADFCDEKAKEFDEVGEDKEVGSCTGPTKGKS